VVGAGVFGLAAALELRRRGHAVTLVDPGPLPHPLAASTDISKVIRMEYGPDQLYTELGERAREGWLAWNQEQAARGEEPLFHETGLLMVSRDPMTAGGFEYESWTLLRRRGHAPERMDHVTVRSRFPAWSGAPYRDGFFHAKGGYAESGRAVAVMARRAGEIGVTLMVGGQVASLVERSGQVTGVRDASGREIGADHVLVAAGAWTAKVVPELAPSIRATGHPVFHLRPRDPGVFHPERFPVFTADISRTGYYGFPLNRDGVVKIGNHGVGTAIDPDAARFVPAQAFDRLRLFLADTFPALADAEIVYHRLCLYADTQDGDFWIARDLARPGLTVASGDSGHGFKFAPVLGAVIADGVEGRANPVLERFKWRPDVRLEHGREAARRHAEE
jgi:glycine/D-amino acid oxidase-like deaminating enzyme